MANNLVNSSASNTGTDYINNFYKPAYTVSAEQDSAVTAFFETITGNSDSARILASSVIYTAIAQGVDPMTIVDQMKNMDEENRNRFTTMFLNFNRVGTSQLGIHARSRYNKYVQRMIQTPTTALADGSTPERAANNARTIKKLTGTSRSDYYWIRGINNQPMQVYCDMSGSEAGSTQGGWMKFDRILVERYRAKSINDFYKDYTPTNTATYTAQPRDGILRGIKWDLGPNIKFVGARITRVQSNCVGGQDGYYAADAPTPQWGGGNPTNTMVANFIDQDYNLGSNFTSYGWSIGNGGTNNNDLIRLYKQASPSEWPAQYVGTVTLSTSAFYQYDTTDLLNGRYIYYYESDGATEYNNLLDYVIWLR
jgi:hypothetical protein